MRQPSTIVRETRLSDRRGSGRGDCRSRVYCHGADPAFARPSRIGEEAAIARVPSRGVLSGVLFALALFAPLIVVACSEAAELSRRRSIGQDPLTGGALAVVVDDLPLIHTGQITAAPTSDPSASAPPGSPQRSSVAELFDTLDGELRPLGSGMSGVVKLNFYLRDFADAAGVKQEIAKRFAVNERPAVAMIVTELAPGAGRLAVDAVAIQTRAVRTAAGAVEIRKAVAAIGGGSHAICPSGSRIYVSGQAARNPSLRTATRETLQALLKTLKSMGRSARDVVQVKAFMSPVKDADVVRSELAAAFGDASPPLVLVQWTSSASTPIEIELVAWGGKYRTGDRVEYYTPPDMRSSPVFSRVARINHSATVYLSGFFSGSATNPVPDDGKVAVEKLFGNIRHALTLSGSDLKHLVKATYYVRADSTSSQWLNKLRPSIYDPQHPPAASKAAVAVVGPPSATIMTDMIAVPRIPPIGEYGPAEAGYGLSGSQAATGWISLFDGESNFGWQGSKVVTANLPEKAKILVGGTTTSRIGSGKLRAIVLRAGTIRWGNSSFDVQPGEFAASLSGPAAAIVLGQTTSVKVLSYQPAGTESLSESWKEGSTLATWKRIDRQSLTAAQRPKWTVSHDGVRAVGGPGCIEYEKPLPADFLLQLTVETGRRHANGGVFFRAIAGDFMNGYEAQVFNQCRHQDPAQPARWATGAIDDRMNARRLVSRDKVPFTMTIIARQRRISVWVNGYQTVDFEDTRPPHRNPRVGAKTTAGALQLQAHDPETDVSFRNIRLYELRDR